MHGRFAYECVRGWSLVMETAWRGGDEERGVEYRLRER